MVRPLRTSLAILAAMVVLASMFVSAGADAKSPPHAWARRCRRAVWISGTHGAVVEDPIGYCASFRFSGLGARRVAGKFLSAFSRCLDQICSTTRLTTMISSCRSISDWSGWRCSDWLVGPGGGATATPRCENGAEVHTSRASGAITAGLIVMAAIESFDFDLQIPANLISFVILVSLALRASIPVEYA